MLRGMENSSTHSVLHSCSTEPTETALVSSFCHWLSPRACSRAMEATPLTERGVVPQKQSPRERGQGLAQGQTAEEELELKTPDSHLGLSS